MMRFLPFAVFAAFCVLAAVSLVNLQHSVQAQSPWVGHTLPSVEALAFDARAAEVAKAATPIVKPRITVLNIFASWCTPCVAEHPLLLRIAQESDAEIVGLAWNDSAENIQQFIEEHGNPYDSIYLDAGRGAGLALGIRGVPETFVIDADGIVRFHFAGPLTSLIIERDILPLLAKKD